MDYWNDEHMRKALLNYWFIVFSILWVIIFTCTKLHFYFWWPIQFYLIDLMAIPILGTLSLVFYRWILQNEEAILPLWSIAFLTIALSVWFEWYLPKHQIRYTADVWDIVMYVLGAIIFNLTMNKSKINEFID
ncbi:MAG: hypothetical protein KJ744_03510 [Bacteroidetes bacterium]|nr:hypothetical protein [Bacteroidota bacterium]MBU2374998.1 hypothetical protein [Bacteroidota bacterium]